MVISQICTTKFLYHRITLNTQEIQYYRSVVIPQLAFAYLFYKALSVPAALQETTEVKLYPGVSPCRLGGLQAFIALLS